MAFFLNYRLILPKPWNSLGATGSWRAGTLRCRGGYRDEVSSVPPIVVVGKVKSTKDPQGLGRVQVELQGYPSRVELPWIRCSGGYASKGFGSVMLPEVGDEILVLRGDGDASDQMLCLGSAYNGTNKPAHDNADGENNVKEFRTRSGNAVTISDKSGEESIHIETPGGKLAVHLDHASGHITLTSSARITLNCSSGDVTVNCKSAKVQASAEVSIQAPQISLAGNVSLG